MSDARSENKDRYSENEHTVSYRRALIVMISGKLLQEKNFSITNTT